jgi:hypothetical protein
LAYYTLSIKDIREVKEGIDNSCSCVKLFEPTVEYFIRMHIVRDRFYPRMNMIEEPEETEDAEAKPKVNTKRLERAQKFKRLQKEYAKNAVSAYPTADNLSPVTTLSTVHKKTNDTKFSNSNKRFKKYSSTFGSIISTRLCNQVRSCKQS